MKLRDEEKKLVEKTWYFVRETNGVIGFADGDNPMPIRADEVETMLGQMREREEKVPAKVAFTIGDKVKVGDGRSRTRRSHRGRRHGPRQAQGQREHVRTFDHARTEYWQVDKTEKASTEFLNYQINGIILKFFIEKPQLQFRSFCKIW